MKPVLLLILFLLSFQVCAENVRREEGNAGAVAQIQNMIRQLTAERDAFRAEAEKLTLEIEKKDKKIEVLNKKLDNAKNRLESSGDRLEKYSEVNNQMRERLLDARDKMVKLVDKYKELVGALKAVEQERQQLSKEVTVKESDLKACARNNLQLVDVNKDLLSQYENKGVWDAMLQKEPVTGLKQVQIENIVEEYSAKLHDLKVGVAGEEL